MYIYLYTTPRHSGLPLRSAPPSDMSTKILAMDDLAGLSPYPTTMLTRTRITHQQMQVNPPPWRPKPRISAVHAWPKPRVGVACHAIGFRCTTVKCSATLAGATDLPILANHVPLSSSRCVRVVSAQPIARGGGSHSLLWTTLRIEALHSLARLRADQ